MKMVRSADAEIFYQVFGKGPPVVLLHPFPVHHNFWLPAVQSLLSHYSLILPDLRGHGESGAGDGPVTMQKHAADISRILDEEKIDRASFVGVSIGGYALFEFWRRYRGRVETFVFFNTRAQADNEEARAARLQTAEQVLHVGTESFFQGLTSKLMGKSTHAARPDLVEDALRMMRKMSAENVSLVQRGMAARPDSVETLKSINVPTMIVTGDEDGFAGPAEAELIRRHINGSQMKVIPRAGHYSPWERPEEAGALLAEFLNSSHG